MIKRDVMEILDNIMENKKFSNVELNNFFNSKQYNYSEKSFIKNILTITLKNYIYIDYILSKITKKISKRSIKNLLRISIAQILFMDTDNNSVIYEANEVAKSINPYQAKFVNFVLNNLLKNIQNINEEINKKSLLDIKYSYPKWLVDKLKIDFGDDYEEIMKSYKKRAYLSIRINKKKIEKEKFLEIFKDDIVFNVEDVYYLSNAKKLDKLETDMYFIQDASSYIVAKNVNAKKDDIILDACSSPGGKTATIISLFDSKEVISTDITDNKIELLKNMKEKYNFNNLKIEKKDATLENNFEKEYFDKILLDVPCSGLGVLRKKPEKIYNLQLSDIKAIKKIQQKILNNNIQYLKKGGELIYSTCTITKTENTNNIKSFLDKNTNFEVLNLDIPENVFYTKDELGGVYINFKNEYLDGFYIIKLKKIKE